jgi:hypothetical protein
MAGFTFMTSKNDLKLYQVTFHPRIRKAYEVAFLIVEFSEASAVYLAWTLFKNSGFIPRDYKNKPTVTIKTRSDSSTETDHEYAQTAL